MQNDPIVDAITHAKQTQNLLDHITNLERRTREMIMEGGKGPRVDAMNQKINNFLGDARGMLEKSRIEFAYAAAELKKQDPNHPKLALIEKKLEQLDLLGKRIDNMQQRVLSRISPPKTDPVFELLRSAPKPSNVDPALHEKMTTTINNLLDQNGIVNDNTIAKTFQSLNKTEQGYFLKELAKRVLQDDNAQLNALKVMSQLSKPDLLPVREAFIVHLRKENKERALDILKNMQVPNAPLPKITPEPIKAPPPKSAQEQKFEDMVKDAVDNGFKRTKEILATIPTSASEERLRFIAAVRDESERRKVEKSFEGVSIPKEAPASKPRP